MQLTWSYNYNKAFLLPQCNAILELDIGTFSGFRQDMRVEASNEERDTTLNKLLTAGSSLVTDGGDDKPAFSSLLLPIIR